MKQSIHHFDLSLGMGLTNSIDAVKEMDFLGWHCLYFIRIHYLAIHFGLSCMWWIFTTCITCSIVS